MKKTPTMRVETAQSWRRLLHESIYDLFMHGWSIVDLCELFSLTSKVTEDHLRNVMRAKNNLS